MTGDSGDLYIGLMSGTSLDGIDVALVELGGSAERPDPVGLIAFHSVSYDRDFRDRLRAGLGSGTPAALCDLNFALGERMAAAAG